MAIPSLVQASGLGMASETNATALADSSVGTNATTGLKTAPTGTPTDGSAKFVSKRKPGFDLTSNILDADWLSRAFCVSDTDLGSPSLTAKDGTVSRPPMPTPSKDHIHKFLEWLAVNNRYVSTASLKFTDTRLGGSIGCNARPQFTPYSDIRVKGENGGKALGRTDVSVNNANTNYGMGRYYSEAIDDTAQRIYLRFGVPQFNTLTNFISGAFNLDTAYYARTGRKSIIKAGAVAVGRIIGIVAFPAISLLLYGTQALMYLFANPSSKYYTLKPTMYMYWSTVNSLVNTIAVTKGLFPTNTPGFTPGQKPTQSANPQGGPLQIDAATLKNLHNLMPDVFTANDGFDIYAMSNKAQRMAYQRFMEDYNAKNDVNGQMTPSQYFARQISKLDPTGTVAPITTSKISSAVSSLSNYLNANLSASSLVDFISNQVEKAEYYIAKATGLGSEIMPTVSADTGATTGITASTGWISSYSKYLDAELRDGASFACFQVAATGSANESFSSEVMQSALSNKINNMGSTARELRFDTEDGNLMGGAGEIVTNVAKAAVDVVTGVASGVTAGISDGIVAMLTGAGFVDVPKHWENSSVSLNRSTYTMQLISPYGNIISQMQNIFIPLSMIMAGALPLSAGKQAYTSPFICQLFDRGRCQIQLGIIDSLSITRGTSNLPFNLFGEVLAIDVSFTIRDLSNIMHMPISPGGIFDPDPSVNSDNILNDFIAVLAGQDIYSQIYAMPRAQMRAAKAISNFNQLTTPARWASMTNDSITNGFMKYLLVPSLIKAAIAGSGTTTQAGAVPGVSKPIS